MYYKVKNVTISRGRIFATVADSSISPLSYFRMEYHPKTELRAPVIQFLADVAAGEFQPLPSARINGQSLYKVALLMAELIKEVPEITVRADHHYDLNMTERLYNLVAGMATAWLFTNDLRITEDDLVKLHSFAAAATAVYAAKRHVLEKKGVLLINSAAHSKVFPGHLVLLDNKNRTYLGKDDRYDNRGHYDNSNFSAVCLSEDPKESGLLFRYLAFGSPSGKIKKPDLDWRRLAYLPEVKEYKQRYAAL